MSILKHTGRNYSFILMLAAAGIFASCSDDHRSETTAGRQAISFNVASVENSTTRSLIESGAKPESGTDHSLQTACTPTEGGRSIGVWADYSLPQTDGSELVFSNIFKNTSIAYQKRNDDNGNPVNDWNYSGDPLFWQIGGIYKFRAFYPQEEMREYITTASSATSFQIDYSTYQLQEDLLVAYNRVNTATLDILHQPTGGTFDLHTPVPLGFKHALAAIMFQFKYKENHADNDVLTSCWLENTNAEESERFATTGVLVYGNSTTEEAIDWQPTFWEPIGEKIYYWQPQSGKAFTDKLSATAYTGQATEGNLYTKNDGYLLVIPQEYKGGLRLCFTTEQGGSTVFKVLLPEATGTDKDGNAVTTPPYYFAAGKRYIYTIALTKTNLDVSLSIADWNVRKTSDEIIF